MQFANTQATTYNDKVVRQFAIMTVVWGVVGMLVGVIIAAQLTWPELNFGISWLSYGRLRPLHTNAVIFAFGGCGLFAAALHAQLKENIAELGDDATKAEIKEAAEAFKEANKEKFAEIKSAHEAIREQIKENRPERPERPEVELSDELKAKVADLKEKRDELHEAKKALYDSLKDASTEEKQAIIAEFKENNKVKHKEIKDNAKALKEEIRGQVETEATRSSDL